MSLETDVAALYERSDATLHELFDRMLNAVEVVVEEPDKAGGQPD